MAQEQSTLGPLVHLRPLQPSQLPAHPDLASLQHDGGPLDAASFVRTILDEAEAFMTSYLATKSKEKNAAKPSPPAKAQVKVLECNVPASDLPPEASVGVTGAVAETWFGRESVHENAAVEGTADWDEFEFALLDDHSAHEMAYTPDVFDARKALEWTEGLEVEGWRKVRLSIYEMAHKIPPPLNNRVFPVVVCTARHSTAHRFLVVQIPVDASKIPSALYSNGKHKQNGDTALKKKDVQLGTYVSIERVEMTEDGKVRWQMATASDAKGILPPFVQKMAVPGAVVKDVGLAVGWLAERRKGNA